MVTIKFKGVDEPIAIEDTFLECVNNLNLASAKGMEFVITRTDTGESIAFPMHNISLIREED